MKILFTNDGSDRALHALPHVARLAAALGAEVVLLRVADSDQDPADAWSVEHAKHPEGKTLQSLAADQGLTVTALSSTRGNKESTADAIVRVADESDVSLIAMDSRGRGIIRQALLGSVAMGVIRKGCYPVFITSPKVGAVAPEGNYQLLVTDDGSPAALEVIHALRPVFESGKINVRLLRIFVPVLGSENDRIELANAREALEKTRLEIPAETDVTLDVQKIREMETVAHAIVRIAKETGASAIAMSTHGTSAVRNIFAGSNAIGVLGTSPVPVILGRCEKS